MINKDSDIEIIISKYKGTGRLDIGYSRKLQELSVTKECVGSQSPGF